MKEELLVLDPAIRDWVVLPMVLVVLLIGLSRHYGMSLLKSSPKLNEQTLLELKNKNTIAQSSCLRINNKFINKKSFLRKKNNFLLAKVGKLRKKQPPPVNPMSNPLNMLELMKGNFVHMIPNFFIMNFVNSFFSGFLCLKVPFALPSSRFRLMLQRGIDLSTLDISYVSSLSWYFLISFGMSGIYKLILGMNVEIDETQMLQRQVIIYYYIIFIFLDSYNLFFFA